MTDRIASIQELAPFGATGDDLAAAAKALLEQQKATWPMLRAGYEALQSVQTRSIPLDGFVMKLQFNPQRLTSTAAQIDANSIRERKCFLCLANLPPEQRGIIFAEDWLILCNPFPIFPEHFTIAHRRHLPQRIGPYFGPMLDLARAMHGRYTIFYNGPKCGASAPDHLHFQAGDKRFMTIETEYDKLKGEPISRNGDAAIYASAISPRRFIAIESDDREAAIKAFQRFCRAFNDLAPADDESMMNVLATYESGEWRAIILPRARHRPSFYSAEGDDKILLSPASVDLGGVCILPLEKDFKKLDQQHLVQMLDEVMLSPAMFAQLAQRMGSKS